MEDSNYSLNDVQLRVCTFSQISKSSQDRKAIINLF